MFLLCFSVFFCFFLCFVFFFCCVFFVFFFLCFFFVFVVLIVLVCLLLVFGGFKKCSESLVRFRRLLNKFLLCGQYTKGVKKRMKVWSIYDGCKTGSESVVGI